MYHRNTVLSDFILFLNTYPRTVNKKTKIPDYAGDAGESMYFVWQIFEAGWNKTKQNTQQQQNLVKKNLFHPSISHDDGPESC